jgi:hypothetical protein
MQMLLIHRPHFENHWSRERVLAGRQHLGTVAQDDDASPEWWAEVPLRKLCPVAHCLQQFKGSADNDNLFFEE